MRKSVYAQAKEGRRQRGAGPMPSHPGYVFLLSVLFVSAIAMSVLGTYLLLSISSLQTGLAMQNAVQSLEMANTCAEYALQDLLDDIGYDGDEGHTLGDASCFILPVGGFGNENRTLCVEGYSGTHTRRLEIVIERILPSVSIYSWREVAAFTACSY